MHAIIRNVSASINECLLTHLDREPIDVGRARQQHHEYVNVLRDLGCNIIELPPADDLPDAVFVEDGILVLDELAVVTRPPSPSRQQEQPAIEAAVQGLRPIHRIDAPGTLEGGDVIVSGRDIFVGRTTRSNDEGIEQLRRIVTPLEYTVHAVNVRGALHLKTAATRIADRTILCHDAWVDPHAFAGHDIITVDADEPCAANTITIGDHVLMSANAPMTRALLEARGLRTMAIDASELAKAEGALTCCSVLLR